MPATALSKSYSLQNFHGLTDLNIQASRNGDNETVISACFSELPESIIIDSAVQTTLTSEYMLNSDVFLEVVKKYKSGGKTGKGIECENQSVNDEELQQTLTSVAEVVETKLKEVSSRTLA